MDVNDNSQFSMGFSQNEIISSSWTRNEYHSSSWENIWSGDSIIRYFPKLSDSWEMNVIEDGDDPFWEGQTPP